MTSYFDFQARVTGADREPAHQPVNTVPTLRDPLTQRIRRGIDAHVLGIEVVESEHDHV